MIAEDIRSMLVDDTGIAIALDRAMEDDNAQYVEVLTHYLNIQTSIRMCQTPNPLSIAAFNTAQAAFGMQKQKMLNYAVLWSKPVCNSYTALSISLETLSFLDWKPLEEEPLRELTVEMRSMSRWPRWSNDVFDLAFETGMLLNNYRIENIKILRLRFGTQNILRFSALSAFGQMIKSYRHTELRELHIDIADERRTLAMSFLMNKNIVKGSKLVLRNETIIK